MRKINTLLLITILFYFTGCEEKKPDNISTNYVSVQSEKIDNIKTNIKTNVKKEKLEKNFQFIFSDIDENNHTVSVKDKKITIKSTKTKEKVILLNFFSTQSPASIGQIPYLIDIQKKYGSKLLIVGILLDTKPDKQNLKILLQREKFNYSIYHSIESSKFTESFTRHFNLNKSFSPPMSILFKNGKQYAHYEGAVPVEMLEYDIKNIINKDK